MKNENIRLVDGKVTKLCNIKAKPIPRNKTFFSALDELYGRSDIPMGDEYSTNTIGMPRGKISLWAGESGVGKSRLCIEVAKKFSIGYTNGIVLYIQTESPLEDFASWAKDTSQYDRFYCSGVETQQDIIDVIYQIKPKLIFIDSVNEIIDFTGNAKSSSRLIKGDSTVRGLKQAVYDVGAHLILLGQLNGDKTIKGGTTLPHLVDIALNITWLDKLKGYFKVEVGVKHRYGSREHIAYFQHTNDGVIAYRKPSSEEINVMVNQIVGNAALNGSKRVPGMTKSGFYTVGSDGFADGNDPEFLEHVANYRVSRKSVTSGAKGVYTKIGNFIGDMLDR